MRVTEALLRQRQQKKQKYDTEEEETLAYQTGQYEYWALNQSKQVFNTPFSDGINTKESVFDQKATFKTKI